MATPPRKDRAGGATNTAGPGSWTTQSPTLSDPLTGYLAQFVRRIIQDALAEATSAYWLRRADAFEWARGGPDRPEQDQRCAETAAMCRFHADLIGDPELWTEELNAYLEFLDSPTGAHPWAPSSPSPRRELAA